MEPKYRLLYSNNGGDNWQSYGDGLPNLPFYDLEYDPHTNGGLYLGTEAGVYYRNRDMDAWIKLDNGIPNVRVRELQVSTKHGIVRAATWGRGLWESPLARPCGDNIPVSVAASSVPEADGAYINAEEVSSNMDFVHGPVTYKEVIYTHTESGATHLEPGFDYKPVNNNRYFSTASCDEDINSSNARTVSSSEISFSFEAKEEQKEELRKQMDRLSLFPIPTSKELNVEFVDGSIIQNITLTNLQGNQVGTYPNVVNSKHTLDVSALAKGSYIISVETEEQIFFKQILIE